MLYNDDHLRILKAIIDSNYKYPKIPNEEDIRSTVYETSKILPQLKELSEKSLEMICRELETYYDISQDLGFSVKAQNYKPWFNDQKANIDFHYWNRYNSYLRHEDEIPSNIISVLDNVTDEIVDYLGDPKLEGSWRRKGMVVGQVQSGKTTNYSSVICKAADVGYKIIILLAGITNDLRKQTQQRLNEAFVGKNATSLREMETGKIGAALHSRGDAKHPQNGTTLQSDFSLKQAEGFLGSNIQNSSQPTIFICKKNVSTLRNLDKFFNIIGQDKLKYPLLLIDDEADNASINTNKDKNRLTKINEGIRLLLNKFEKSSYIGYTATPFANIFIEPDTDLEMENSDLFPSDYIKVLKPPTNYFGPEKIFLNENINENMVKILDDYEEDLPLKHKNHHPLEKLPDSLKKAVRVFVLSKTIRILRGDQNKHSTMMINVSRFNSVQDRVHDLVYDYKNELENHIELTANRLDRVSNSEIINTFEKDYFDEFSNKNREKINEVFSPDYSKYPDWIEIKHNLLKALKTIKVQVVNMKRGSLEYEKYKDEGLNVIAIGGLALSRGLTLEGLCVSYVLRNASAYDTLMQMGRWFGYRKGYSDLCRLFLPSQSNSYYQDVTEAVNDLNIQIETMELLNQTPLDFGLKVRENRGAIRITAANKMRSAERVTVSVGYSGKHVQAHTIYSDNNVNLENRKSTKTFIQSLDKKADKNKNLNIPDFFWSNINVDKILSFLSKVNFPTDDFIRRGNGSYVIDYINKRKSYMRNWDVVLDNVAHEIKHDHIDNELLEDGITPRKRHKGSFENDKKHYKVTNSRKITSANIKYGLDNSDLEKDSEGNIIGSEIDFNRIRKKPLLLIMVFDAKPSDEKNLNSESVHKEYSISISINFPGDVYSSEDVKLEYQANLVYQYQEEFIFEDNEEEELDEILDLQVA